MVLVYVHLRATRMVGKERAWGPGREKERVRFVVSVSGLQSKDKYVSCGLAIDHSVAHTQERVQHKRGNGKIGETHGI